MPGAKRKDFTMSFSIQTNVNALIAQENLRVNGNFQSRTIQRLTSGYRINSSGDDAAGLAVANKFRADTTELTQGVRNANDGLSQLQIVDGGVSNIAKMLDRMKTLATQSASTTFTGDRGVLQGEYSKLINEIDRQAANIGLGGAAGTDAGRFVKSLGVYIGGASTTQGNASVNVDLTSGRVDTTQLGINSTNINGTVTMQAVGSVDLSTAGAKFLANTSQDFQISTAGNDLSFTISGGSAGLTKDQFLTAINSHLAGTGVAASMDATTGALTLGSSKGFVFKATAAGVPAQNAVTAGTYTRDTDDYFVKDMGAITAYSSGGADDTYSVQVKVDNTVTGTFTLNATAKTVDEIFAGMKTAAATSGLEVVRQGDHMYLQGNKTFTVTTAYSAGADVTDDRIGGFAGAIKNDLNVATGVAGATVAGDLTSGALDSLTKVTTALSSLATIQGTVGAGQNMLNYAISLAQSQISNFSAAEAGIRDTDVAQEAANLTKAQVLQQASMAAMAQANSAPQAVLALLRG
jgi:flagellin